MPANTNLMLNTELQYTGVIRSVILQAHNEQLNSMNNAMWSLQTDERRQKHFIWPLNQEGEIVGLARRLSKAKARPPRWS